MSVTGGSLSREVSVQGLGSLSRGWGLCSGVGVSVGGRGEVCLHPSRGETPPPVNRITDRCKNITFPQLSLRAATSSCISLEYTLLEVLILRKINVACFFIYQAKMHTFP